MSAKVKLPKTIQEKLIAQLKHQGRSKFVKRLKSCEVWTHPSDADLGYFYYIGRNGSLRTGTNREKSWSANTAKVQLLEAFERRSKHQEKTNVE